MLALSADKIRSISHLTTLLIWKTNQSHVVSILLSNAPLLVILHVANLLKFAFQETCLCVLVFLPT